LEITFLTLEEVIELHNDQIQRYGGEPTIRDTGLLQSAIAMPAATFGGEYLHESPHGMAAAYLFHLVSNHPFVDGNKRTGLAAALAFLYVHDLDVKPERAEVEQLVLNVACGKLEKSDVMTFFRAHVRP
jgi:death-on-curing protein